MNNLFIKASKNKFRFNSTKGKINVEDLWAIGLSYLDGIAVNLHKELEESKELSFIATPTSKSKELSDKLEICKFIIGERLAAAEKLKVKKANRAKLEKIQAIRSKKSDEALENLTEAELDELEKSLL